jgi:hypothetical protein
MRQRTELIAGVATVFVLAVGAALIGAERARLTDADPRRSSFLAGPSGAKGLADGLRRLGVVVDTWRRPVGSLDSSVPPGTLTAFVGPTEPLDLREGAALAALRRDLLLAGGSAAAAMRCLGWDVRFTPGDSLRLRSLPGAGPMPPARAVLSTRSTPVVTDSGRSEDAAPVSCTVPSARAVDTLLRTADGRPVAVVVGLIGGRRVTLVADDRLFTNRLLRDTGAGPFALGLVVPRYDRVVVDEYHHGFDASASLAGAAASWTLHSPVGWSILQLCAVGVLALLAAGVRFGPVRPGLPRRRRSPLEHVRALAAALAAARGHDTAVGLMVQGLRRRLAGAGHRPAADLAEWLRSLEPALRTPEGHQALDALTEVTRRSATAEDVLTAAGSVETLWEELTPR